VTTPSAASATRRWAPWASSPGKWKLSLFEALFSDSLHAALNKRALDGLHEFGRYVNDLEYRARHAYGAKRPRVLAAGVAQGHRLREAPLRRRRKREAGRARWTNVLDFMRLDGASAAAARSRTPPA
jgi:ATP-dependent DNA helicase Rep